MALFSEIKTNYFLDCLNYTLTLETTIETWLANSWVSETIRSLLNSHVKVSSELINFSNVWSVRATARSATGTSLWVACLPLHHALSYHRCVSSRFTNVIQLLAATPLIHSGIRGYTQLHLCFFCHGVKFSVPAVLFKKSFF
jgi:hypothetical protein